MQIVAQIILARILGPSQYGIFAVAAISVSLTILLTDSGLGAILVKEETLAHDTAAFVMGWQLLLGTAAALAMTASSSWVADFTGIPSSADVLRIMSLACILNAAASVPTNILRRELRFKAIHGAQLTGFVAGYFFVGIPSAMLGAQVWSLVAAWLAQSLLSLLILVLCAGGLSRPTLISADWRRHLEFGRQATLSNAAAWITGNVDKIVVARAFGATDLGLYSTANNLLGTAVTQVLATLQQVSFSAASRISGNHANVQRLQLMLVEAGGLLFFPFFVAIAAVPALLLEGLYGPSWSAGSNLVTPIALTMAVYGLCGIFGPTLWAVGRVASEAKMQIASAALISFAVLIFALSSSAEYIAWAVFGATLIRLVFFLRITSEMLGIELLVLCSRLGLGAKSAVIAATAAKLFELTVHQFSWPKVLQLVVVASCVAAVGGAASFWLVRRSGSMELNDLLVRFYKR